MTSKQGRFALALAGLLLTGSVWAQTAPETAPTTAPQTAAPAGPGMGMGPGMGPRPRGDEGGGLSSPAG